MSALNQTELEKLSCMYDGDKARDASSNIRGFLFQDYVTIRRLLQPGVEYVCSEYLEDVDAFYTDSKFEFIQVKYYPKTSARMKEIATDLYYQFLRLQILNSDLNAVPALYIHTSKPYRIPDANDMKDFMGFAKDPPEDGPPKPLLPACVPVPSDPKEWLKSQVHAQTKKDAQKKALFDAMASEKTLAAFLRQLEVTPQDDIVTYKEELLEELGNAYENPDPEGDEEHWQMILLGLAVSYIQRRYILTDPDFAQLRVDKAEFDRYIVESARTQTEQTIASYLVGCVSEEFDEILEDNELSELQINMLNRICKNTMRWIGQLCGETAADRSDRAVEGQHMLLNTFSSGNIPGLDVFRKKTVSDRLRDMAGSKRDFSDFLDYLWKIMLDLCQDQINEAEELDRHQELFDPAHYIVPEVREYVCLCFPEDKMAKYSVILPSVLSKPERIKRKVIARMVNMPQKPEKWLFRTEDFMRGIHPYNYETSNINDKPTIVDLGAEHFYIECMKCIRVDHRGWEKHEHCGGCIFSQKCAEGGMKL